MATKEEKLNLLLELQKNVGSKKACCALIGSSETGNHSKWLSGKSEVPNYIYRSCLAHIVLPTRVLIALTTHALRDVRGQPAPGTPTSKNKTDSKLDETGAKEGEQAAPADG